MPNTAELTGSLGAGMEPPREGEVTDPLALWNRPGPTAGACVGELTLPPRMPPLDGGACRGELTHPPSRRQEPPQSTLQITREQRLHQITIL